MGTRLRAAVVAVTMGLTACAGTGSVGDGEGASGAAEPTPAPTGDPAPSSDDGGAGVAPAPPASELADAIRSLPPAPSSPTVAPAAPAPVALRIDALGVAGAPVVPVGVMDSGELEVPGAAEVGWYRYGAHPGRPGTSVLAAHIAYDGVNGVFAQLAGLEVGATVEVELEDQQVVTYVVTELTTYAKTALPFDDIFGPGDDPRLVLISCGGRFDPVARSYDSNVVAYAVPAPAPA